MKDSSAPTNKERSNLGARSASISRIFSRKGPLVGKVACAVSRQKKEGEGV